MASAAILDFEIRFFVTQDFS